jgi:D-alanyl-lipoteichoic acid acyltransferase DltB (MBOAT superfamily)
MLFHTHAFLFGFLPITVIVYYVLRHSHLRLAKYWLIASSLFFYAYWNPAFLPLLLVSMSFNYLIGQRLMKHSSRRVLVLGVAINVIVLGYFKYTGFLLDNLHMLGLESFGRPTIILPLAISFFTFQQIAYLVDCYRQHVEDHNFADYLLFVCYFPQLIAGPIIHHKEIMHQFARPEGCNGEKFCSGLLLLSVGLFKKIILADAFAATANSGFDRLSDPTALEAWICSLSYTLQLYFDFSGYTDMALGIAKIMGIDLPQNFNSPYKAVNIQDFWQRWHMTLSRFLRDYVYIPLGGNRTAVYRNLFVTFLLGGLWHGAGWTFIVWGALHGAATVVHRLWSKTGMVMPKMFGWALTFCFVNFAWIFFRARSLQSAWTLSTGLFGMNGSGIGKELRLDSFSFAEWPITETNLELLLLLSAFTLAVSTLRNTDEMAATCPIRYSSAILSAVCLSLSLLSLDRVSEFIYFNF